MQAVILAGGLGTRLKPYTNDNPKPMIPINGKPFLQYLIEQIASWGITDVVLLLGYKADKIIDYFGDGDSLSVNIQYCVTPVEYDTGKRLMSAFELLQNEFILLYCDNYCPIDYKVAEKQFRDSDNTIQITAYTNRDVYTKNNIKASDNKVEKYDKKRNEEGLNAVDIGYAFIKKEAVKLLSEENVNFEAEVYPMLVADNKMGVFLTEHRYYSIGSWERIDLTKEFFRTKKVVFLDRDGTINERPPRACYIEKPEDFRWLPNAKEALKQLKEKGYTIYLITNQPGIARGNLTEDMLEKIHAKMESDLLEIGVTLDDIYFCPHNWDEGCDCRKPKPGMLFQAQKDHSLNLSQCYLIGDDERDIEAGISAGVKKTFLISENRSLFDIVGDL